MRRKLLASFFIVYICCALTECKSQNMTAVQIVFFDLNDFERTDTLLIDNPDTVNSIKALFSTMTEVDAKFPRKYQITFFGKPSSEVYYSNGKFVRGNRKVYELSKGKELILFESLLESLLKKRKTDSSHKLPPH